MALIFYHYYEKHRRYKAHKQMRNKQKERRKQASNSSKTHIGLTNSMVEGTAAKNYLEMAGLHSQADFEGDYLRSSQKLLIVQ
mmetsp:Transcript_36888/g.48479  ORF Transcript_36888/g.48479 Transcript_36888/m.48479 type:complete len:83 (-) Transcript_36888:325-573(-)